MRVRSVWCSIAWRSGRDCTAGGHTYMARCGCDRYAPRYARTGRRGADRVVGEPLLGSRIRVSWQTRGFDKPVVVVGGWTVPVFETARARSLRMAAGHGGQRAFIIGTALDVARRD